MRASFLWVPFVLAAGTIVSAAMMPACGGDSGSDVFVPDEGGLEASADSSTNGIDGGGVKDAGALDAKADASPSSCPTNEVKCTAGGACSNLREDPSNCGACGTVCTVSAPVLGAPTFTKITEHQPPC
jgi:hypothetical protein